MFGRNPEAADVKRPAQLAEVADGLAAAVAVSLPWSTSATSILVVLWLIALVPTLDGASLKRELRSAAGGLPVLLWVLGALGMLWAEASWSERIAGLSGFHKLLVLPLLLAQFRRCARAQWVVLGFLASAIALLVVSWVLVLAPGLPWRGSKALGVPVKDYIFQSAIFAVCAFGLIGRAAELWRGRPRLALGLIVLAAAFIANVGYVATARTTLVVMAVLLLLLGMRQFGFKGALGACLIGGVLAAIAWTSSPYLRERVAPVVGQLQNYAAGDVTSVGLRLEYWTKSLAFIAEKPIFGQGTGTIPRLFRREATPGTDPMLITDNPHNQILTVAVEVGLLGAVVLVGLWIAHLALFCCERTLIAWLGLVIVVQNMVGSLFNSYLFDFSQGWLYVFGVGAIGGTVLHGARVPGSSGVER
jgi:O-antigen ligase